MTNRAQSSSRRAKSGILPVPRASYSVEEAASALGIGRTYVFRLIKNGELDAIRLGKRTLVPVASIEALIQRHLKVIQEAPLPTLDNPE